ncbi:MAG: amidohydrolase [Verrucomicrobiae bacterium]|nr:amidohydrolase [Verrucomicrobiae bacterium]
MTVDIHSHAWPFPDAFSDDFIAQASSAKPDTTVDLTVTYEAYRATVPEDTRTVVFGGKAKLAGIWVDDRYIADYVNQHPDTLIGFLSIDPTQPDWQDELRHGHEALKLRGIKLLPMYAGFKVNESSLDPLWEYAQKHGLPVLLHTGTTFIRQAPLECTFPHLIETVALKYPGVKFILAHLSHPWEGECIVTIRKHPNVFADISALHYRPYQLYQSLMLVQEYGVWNKLLFGSDYPFTTVNASIDGLRKLNDMVEGTALPRLDLDQIEALIHRDSLALLGLD